MDDILERNIRDRSQVLLLTLCEFQRIKLIFIPPEIVRKPMISGGIEVN